MNVNVVKEGSALREAFKEFGIDYKVGMTVAEEYIDKVFALKQTYGLYTYDTDAHYACIKKWIKNSPKSANNGVSVLNLNIFLNKLTNNICVLSYTLFFPLHPFLKGRWIRAIYFFHITFLYI